MQQDPATSNSTFTAVVAELVAIGAAIGANCEPCFKYHYSQARKLGVSNEDVARAVALADKVKRAPAQNMLTLADKILGTSLSQGAPAPDPACCSDSRGATPAKPAKGKCCRPKA